MSSAKVTKRGEHLVCRKVHTHLEVSGSTILQKLLCLIFSTGHIQNTVQTHQMMNNTSLMSGVRIWRRIILSLITGTPSYSWNSSSFLRSQREQHFVSYVESLGKIIPWMFALDHYHYARWMTVHVRDLLTLENTCPTTHEQFLNGNFVTQKTSHKFSALAHDQVHE